MLKKSTTTRACPKPSDKHALRRFWASQRSAESSLRQDRALPCLTQRVIDALGPKGLLLSYAPIRDEFSTEAINQHFAGQGRLVLPRVVGETLELRIVHSLEDLAPGPLGTRSPIVERCPLVSPPQISLALVPGLAFDQVGTRLGYGGGYYDRLLPLLKCPIWGVGYQTQLSTALLPREPHDHPVTHLHLF